MLLSLCYTRYLAPIQAVIIRGSTLSRDAGEQYAKVSNQPISSGSTVMVLDVVHDGQWLKILSPSGELGYVPYTVIRII